MAAWCLGQCGRGKLLADRPKLLDDLGPVDFYEDGHPGHTSVGELARLFIE